MRHAVHFLGGSIANAKFVATSMGLIATGLAACAPAARPPQISSLPDVIVIRVDNVEVSAFHPGTQETWDGEAPETDPAAVCKLVALGTGLVNPVLGAGTEAICGFSQPAQVERSPTNPDLQLRLSAGQSTKYESFVESDQLAHNFSYEFVIPTNAIPSDGLRLDVLDAEGDGEPETIGSVRLSAAMLAGTFASPAKLLTLQPGAVTRLEIVVSQYAPLTIPQTQTSAKITPLQIAKRALMAGEVVSIHTAGSYTVGSWFTDQVDPSGYPNDAAKGFNFKQPPFDAAPHACAIALIGKDREFEGVVIRTERRFVVAHGGPLRLGLNDTDPDNNEGWFSFGGSARAPTVGEWLKAASN